MSTVWASEEARAAGSLDGNVQCDADSVPEAFHRSKVTQKNCEELDPLLSGSSTENSFSLYYDISVGCGDPNVPSTEEASFLDHCGCDDPEPYSTTVSTHVEGCSWIGAEFTDIPELSGYCFAVAISRVSFGDEDSEDLLEYFNPFERYDCWPKVASGTATITIFAFVMTLVTHVAEGFVVRQKVRYPDKGPSLRVEIGASVVEAVGVVAIFWVLSSFTSYRDNSNNHDSALVLEGLALFAVACAVLGLLAVVLAGYGGLHITPPFFEASCLLGKRSLLGVTGTRPAGGE
ncbi:unnamed protein product [Ectocarpus sp. CCAP 1310/34]|nr:unnamed protein product [Ectocarpus sp. CCAP 1310/34]